jgi:signal transduction histidine kinase
VVSTTSPPLPVSRWSRARSFVPSLLLDGAAEDDALRPARRSARDWFVDVVAFVLAVAFAVASFATTFPDGPSGDALAYVDLASGVVLCVAMWWRRRWPVALALATVPFGAFAASTGGPSIVLLFSLAVHRPFRVVAAVTVLQLAVLVPFFRIHPDPEMSYWTAIVVVSALIVAVTAWGLVVRSRRQLLSSLRERAERAEREQHLLVDQARQAERARIAREMHDALAHRISLLSMHAGALEFRPDASPADVGRAAGVIRASAHEALEDLREVIGVLRHTEDDDAPPAPERPQPTLCDVPALLEESRAAGMRVDGGVTVAATEDVPRSLGRNAYRVVQEGLTNVRKHAAGTRTRVAVTGSPADGLTVEVHNAAPVGGAHGPAEGPALPGAGTGIVGLAERTMLAGGRLEHGRTADGGFVLRAWMPWGSAA